MPNRVIREGILDSARIAALKGWASECFYRRLMSVVDDFGFYDARPELLRSKLYPVVSEKVTVADIEKWLADCSAAGLVSLYSVGNKPYLRIVDFNQSIRQKKSKFPQPDENACNCMQMNANAINCSLNPIQSESNPIQRVDEENFSSDEKNNLVLIFLKDLPNSSQLQTIAMLTQEPLEKLKAAIPAFKTAAQVSYRNMNEFSDHFKRWYFKNKDTLVAGNQQTKPRRKQFGT